MISRALLSVTAAALLIGCAAQAQPADQVQVQVLGALAPEDSAAFTEVAADFTADTGIEVVYTPASDLLTEVGDPSPSGPTPEVVLFDNPGVFNILTGEGLLEPLDGVVDDGALLPVLDFAGTDDGQRYGLPVKVGLYNLVWYPPAAFQEAGYEVPEDYDELVALMARMRDDGQTPWCIAIESMQDTGWVLTDWIEVLVLDGAGPDAYDRWTTLGLPFSSPEVNGAAARFGQLVVDDEGNVYGGRIGLLGGAVNNAALPMLEDPPDCLMHRQNSFFSAAWGEDVELGEDIDLFAFPPLDARADRSLVGSTTLATLAGDSPEAEEFLRFLGSAEASERWAEIALDGTFLSPRADFDASGYDVIGRRQAEILADADVFRLDASQQMYREVGALAFHQQMIDWVFGRKTLPQATAAIDDAAAEAIEAREER